jgi:hypothetical protein
MVRPYLAFDLAPSERERDPMTLAAVGTLFPAIPLAIVALNFRYTSLAGLMRAISSQLDSSGIDGARRTTLLDELHVMKRRMTLVKYALFLSGIAFILNLASLYFGYFSFSAIAPVIMALTIMSMISSMICFCAETVLSTKALNLHIAGVLQH